MTHEIALDKATMTYSWHNISDQYQNNQMKYSPDGSTSSQTVKFVDRMYTYSDLNGHVETQTMQTAYCRLQTVQTVQTVQTECYFF